MMTEQAKRLDEQQQRLVLDYRPLVGHVMRHSNAGMYLDRDERRSVAYLALAQAALNFRPGCGAQFKTYAYSAIVRNLRLAGMESGLIRVGRHAYRKGVSQETRDHIRMIGRVRSLWGRDGEMRIDPADHRNPRGSTPDDIRMDRLERAIGTIPSNHRTVMRHRLDGLTANAISGLMGISRQRVCQIQDRAIKLLRTALEEMILLP